MVMHMVISGAVLLPWADLCAGVVFMVMPGQEEGHALADVLFGDVNPTGDHEGVRGGVGRTGELLHDTNFCLFVYVVMVWCAHMRC